jgi:uncharacterized delta-60 repeat protein
MNMKRNTFHQKDSRQIFCRIRNPVESRLLFTVLALLALAVRLQAAPGDVDPSFDAGSVVNGSVSTLVHQPDGKIVIGGNFTTVRGALRKGLARLNADGTADLTFNPATNESFTWCVALQPDGKLWVASGFLDFGHSRSRLVRLHADGTLDTSFEAAIADSWVRSMTVCPDGKVIVQGYFTNINGIDRKDIARLNPDGSIDTTFNPASHTGHLVAGYGSSIHAHAVQPDGKVIVGGSFTALGGVSRKGIGRLNVDGSLDRTFDPGSGLGIAGLNTVAEGVVSIAEQSDGKVLVGGRFSSINGISRLGLARLHSDGSPDLGFDARFPRDSLIESITIQPDGKALIFGHVANQLNRFARLNVDGSWDTSFNSGAEVGAGDISGDFPIVLQADGKILRGLARFNGDGSQDRTFDPRPSGGAEVKTMVSQPDGKVLIGGEFDTIQGERRDGIARLNSDGSLDRAFHPSIVQPGWMGVIEQIQVQPNGKILMSGRFASVAGVKRTNFARLNADGTLDTSFNPVRTGSPIAVQADGKVLVAVNWSDTPIARLNADGSADIPFTTSAAFTRNGAVSSIAIDKSGKILLGGQFPKSESEGGYYNLARLNADGSLDAMFYIRSQRFPDLSAYIGSVIVQSDGKALVAGAVDLSDTYPAFITRLNVDGTADTTFKEARGRQIVALQPDGKILIGGRNDPFFGENSVERLNADGTLDMTFNAGTAANDWIVSVLPQADGKLLVAGRFTIINGVPSAYVARLLGDPIASLDVSHSDKGLTLSWPTNAVGFTLQSTTNLSDRSSWTPVLTVPVIEASRNQIADAISGPAKFYRLRR